MARALIVPRPVRCEPPRSPELVLGLGPAARALAERLLQLQDAELAAVECAAAENLLLARAPAEQLPWVDGVL